MKISELIKQLQKAKRTFGDISVGADVSPLNIGEEELFSEESCVVNPEVLGVYKLRYEDSNRPKKVFVLCVGNGDSHLSDDINLMEDIRAR